MGLNGTPSTWLRRRSWAGLLALCLVLGWTLAAPTGAIAAPDNSWQVQPVPRVTPTVPYWALSSVSCPTASFCAAVGFYYGVEQAQHPLVETWDGTEWSVAQLDETQVGALGSVSCSSAMFCQALGSVPGVAEKWDGSSWTSVPYPATPSDYSFRLDCVSSSFCMATGEYYNSGGSGVERSVTWRWNGSSWTRALPPALSSVVLRALSCSTTRSCFAVAQVVGKYKFQIEHWNGRHWSPAFTGIPAGAELAGIACPQPGYCTATGTIGDFADGRNQPRAVIVNLSGAAGWSYVAPQKLAGIADVTLGNVSCSSARVCSATASYGEGLDGGPEGDYTVATRGPTGGFHIVQRTATDAVGDISCSTGGCTVVGFSPIPEEREDYAVGPGDVGVIEQGPPDALQSVSPATPPLYTVSNTTLSSVSCVASGFCAATVSVPGYPSDPALYVRSGGTWQHADGTGTKPLNSVDCLSDLFCMAIGDSSAEEWTGTSWTQLSVPSTDTTNLSSVSCMSPTACVAVGSARSYPVAPLTEAWDGISWRAVTTPSPGSAASLNSVSCPSLSRCIAVGYYVQSGAELGLVESWDGTSWTVMPTAPASPNSNVDLSAVSCSTMSSCMVIDTHDYSGPRTSQWDGTQWSAFDVGQPQPLYSGNYLSLFGISCTSPTACTAVGNEQLTGKAVVEDWDGANWHVSEGAGIDDPTNASRVLDGVSCTAVTTCTAVGYIDGLGLLVEERI